MKYWLIKSEPSDYSIDDLKRDRHTAWTGIRNYQARNYMRDQMQIGDQVIFYHSNGKPPAAVGVAEVCSLPHPDETAFDPADSHFDPRSTRNQPVWMLVDMAFSEQFLRPVSLDEIKVSPALAGSLIAKPGTRLSVQPLSPIHFAEILRLGRQVP